MGAVGVAAVGAAAVGNAIVSSPAEATTGEPLLIGEANSTSSLHDRTSLTGGEGFFASTPEGHIGVEGQALTATPGSLGVKGTGVIGVQGVTIGGLSLPGPASSASATPLVPASRLRTRRCLPFPPALWDHDPAGVVRARPVHRVERRLT